ncbi:hypothetical protein QFZ20_004456 [Flavobacterium sp. W4I14]|nr:hypothetical protein [Flavobacterium sp. W4I14]
MLRNEATSGMQALPFHFLKRKTFYYQWEMSGSVLLAFSVPLFGTSSDEESEALPGNRVYLTKFVP